MWDAKSDLKHNCGIELDDNLVCHQVLYADDTLLIDCFGSNLQKFMECIADHSKSYGLQLNWDKIECMPINCQSTLFTPSGDPILTKSSIKYLRAQLSSDAKLDSEVSQKIGNAKRDFKILNSIWQHSNLTRKFKFQVYIACVLQKLSCFMV